METPILDFDCAARNVFDCCGNWNGNAGEAESAVLPVWGMLFYRWGKNPPGFVGDLSDC